MIESMVSGNKQDAIDMEFIKDFFSTDSARVHRIRNLACRVREGVGKINSFIQESTSAVCPECKSVCCRNKHGFHNEEDMIYLSALGIDPPPNNSDRQDADPCHFLGEKGCSLERVVRPSGCNWYFCDPLYDYMEEHEGYAEFDRALGDVAELWMQMTEEFRKAFQLPS